uniref:Mitochondrial carrier n=1 Tax=Anopheles epiroticus TaxID=199890 RepID=A0A182PDU9_9DIPT
MYANNQPIIIGTPLREKREEEDVDVDSSLRFGFRLVCSTALYPLEYAKTLIQLGYEPIAPRPGRTLFGARRLMLPNIFQYAAYIKSVDGFTGCFRGLSARLLGNVLGSYYGERLAIALLSKPPKTVLQPDFFEFGVEMWEKYDFNEPRPVFKADIVSKAVTQVCGIVISHPFHVISIRMMAQFIGREHLYDGLFGSIKEIWVQEGIRGFFSGLIPRLWMEACCMALTTAISYLFKKYSGANKTICGHVDTISHFTVTSMLYPYHVVSTCMAVQGCRLKAGNPPFMDHFISWRHCHAHLTLQNQHKRGSSFFFRTVARAPGKINDAFAPYPEMK